MSDRASTLSRVAQGDKRAMQECVDRFGGLIWSMALRYCRSRPDAEDVVQEVFVEVWGSAERYRSELGSEEAFIATIARRRLIDWRRRQQRLPTTEFFAEPPGRDAPQLLEIESEDEVQRIWIALDSFPEGQREALKR
ncbi:MAG: sigma-70 family RNA polymerase sigma factor, partial [Planctomycetota bacterium]